MSADKPRGKVERGFQFDNREYRVVSVGKHTAVGHVRGDHALEVEVDVPPGTTVYIGAGYQDAILLQILEMDEAGGDRWITVTSTSRSDNDIPSLLLKIIANAKLA